MHVIRVEHVPWTLTKKSLALFFANYNIVDGEHGVHFIVDNDTIYNNAFIQLASSQDITRALKRKELHIFKFLVKSMMIFSLHYGGFYTWQ